MKVGLKFLFLKKGGRRFEGWSEISILKKGGGGGLKVGLKFC